VTQKYGVFDEKAGRPQRSIFVVDKEGILRWIKKYEAGVLPDNAELLAELKKL
jgi:alkyl hydroperoxide reductase subunit AhpC